MWGESGAKGANLSYFVTALKTGAIINKYKMAKHFILDIQEQSLNFRVDDENVAAEAALDGIYVLRTSLPKERLSTEDIVRSYKSLSQVERAFRSMKTMDLKIRPIRHRLEDRVRAHIFLCMLAYYVEWHMRESLRSVLFCDEAQELKKTRDPVAPAKRSKAALEKASSKVLAGGGAVHSFQTLLKMLSTIVRNRCRVPASGPNAPTFDVLTTPTAEQQRAYSLLEAIAV